MEVLLIVVFFLLGAAVGSFLNVCSDRLPAGRSLLRPPSHCEACQRRLSPLDLIPVVSFLWLRGRCRYCGAAVPWRIFWVEVGTGLLFAFLYWYYGLSLELAVTAVYSSLFIMLLVIDLEHQLILNKVVYPTAAAALLADVFLPQPGILLGAAGGAVGFALLLLPALVFRGGMGWGDVKMAGLVGIVVGFPQIFVAIFGAMIVGGAVAATLLLLRVKGRKDAIPYGPFLSIAAIVTMLFGGEILTWYLGLFG